MHIKEWLNKNNKKQLDLARIIKRDPARAHRIVHGKIPTKEEMALIIEASNGEVTPNDFYGFSNV